MDQPKLTLGNPINRLLSATRGRAEESILPPTGALKVIYRIQKLQDCKESCWGSPLLLDTVVELTVVETLQKLCKHGQKCSDMVNVMAIESLGCV